jgi:hypothetical protein
MKIVQNEITWTQTNFSTNFGGKTGGIKRLTMNENCSK